MPPTSVSCHRCGARQGQGPAVGPSGGPGGWAPGGPTPNPPSRARSLLLIPLLLVAGIALFGAVAAAVVFAVRGSDDDPSREATAAPVASTTTAPVATTTTLPEVDLSKMEALCRLGLPTPGIPAYVPGDGRQHVDRWQERIDGTGGLPTLNAGDDPKMQEAPSVIMCIRPARRDGPSISCGYGEGLLPSEATFQLRWLNPLTWRIEFREVGTAKVLASREIEVRGPCPDTFTTPAPGTEALAGAEPTYAELDPIYQGFVHPS